MMLWGRINESHSVALARAGWPLAVVFLAVLASSLAVVQVTHHARQLFSLSEQLEQQTRTLEEDWERLLLERGTWASQERIERVARQQLQMKTPPPDQIQVIGNG
ncbi:MAG: cell division protein FtsL [Spongiibacteraceae bacterium]|jgi:cell division protein FtsL|nr:cell division protein FtsL [Spongiibacteraceae bacterium]